MKIGILKESATENRVSLLPDAISVLINMDVKVLVEENAGIRAFSSNEEYKKAGAEVLPRDQVISGSDLLVSIHPPEVQDLDKMAEGKVLLSVLNPLMNQELIKSLAEKNITSFSMDIIPRTTRAQAMDILSSQATVAGYKAVIDAAGRFSGFMPMLMTAAGTVKPAKVLILGAGVAGLQAIAIARKLGAVVEAFDVRSAAKEEVMSLGAKFVEVEGAVDDAKAGGYAVEQSEEYRKKQQQIIQEHAIKSDIVICTAQIPGKKAPVLLLKETVESMKPGSIIIDLAASTGGNCELTKNKKVIIHKQITIVGNSDYPSEMPYDASLMFGKNIMNFLKLIIDKEGNLNLNFNDDIVQGTCVTHKKEIINQRIKEFFNK